jgi:hypothetical protein
MFTPDDEDAYLRVSADIGVHLRFKPSAPPLNW